MLSNVKSGVAIATAAAAMFSMGTLLTAPAYAGDGVHCTGANSCKGTSDCKSAKNECKGMNSCKGMGWVSKKSADECTKAGGKVAKG